MKYASIVDLRGSLTLRSDVRRKAETGRRDGLRVEEIPFAEFKSFYKSIVSVEKSEEVWAELAKLHFAFAAKKGGRTVSAAAFCTDGTRDVYYSLAVSDYSLSESRRAAYLLQWEVMQEFKKRGYRYYVVGSKDLYKDPEKSQRLWEFKKQFGNLYLVDGAEYFPFTTYTKVAEPPESRAPDKK